jgi:hypothetical protein
MFTKASHYLLQSFLKIVHHMQQQARIQFLALSYSFIPEWNAAWFKTLFL